MRLCIKKHLDNMWKLQNNQLVREFKFEDFEEAIQFINSVAVFCNTENHHPEIINVYNKVQLSFCTHDEGNSVTELDYKLAALIDTL